MAHHATFPPNNTPVIQRILALTTVLLGIALMVYMIAVEGEPGALPLLLAIGGALWYLSLRKRIQPTSKTEE